MRRFPLKVSDSRNTFSFGIFCRSCQSRQNQIAQSQSLQDDGALVRIPHEITHGIIGVEHGYREVCQKKAKELGVTEQNLQK